MRGYYFGFINLSRTVHLFIYYLCPCSPFLYIILWKYGRLSMVCAVNFSFYFFHVWLMWKRRGRVNAIYTSPYNKIIFNKQPCLLNDSIRFVSFLGLGEIVYRNTPNKNRLKSPNSMISIFSKKFIHFYCGFGCIFYILLRSNKQKKNVLCACFITFNAVWSLSLLSDIFIYFFHVQFMSFICICLSTIHLLLGNGIFQICVRRWNIYKKKNLFSSSVVRIFIFALGFITCIIITVCV